MTTPEGVDSPTTLATHGSAAADRDWFPVIEALRGIAAVGVVIDHCWALADGNPQVGFGLVQGLGTWGVDVFFLLSGYLLCDYFWRKDRRPSIREFYVRRFFRIAPLYYVVVGIVFLFYAPHSELFSGLGLQQVLANATLTQWLFPGTASNLNVDGSIWTLTIEMLLYLTMPFLAWVIGRWPIRGALGLAGLGLGYRLYISLAGGPLADWYWGSLPGPGMGIERLFLVHQFLGVLPLFVLGMFARRIVLYTRLRLLVQRSKRKPSLAVVLVLLVPSILILRGQSSLGVQSLDLVHRFRPGDWRVGATGLRLRLTACRGPTRAAHEGCSVGWGTELRPVSLAFSGYPECVRDGCRTKPSGPQQPPAPPTRHRRHIRGAG